MGRPPARCPQKLKFVLQCITIYYMIIYNMETRRLTPLRGDGGLQLHNL